MFTLRDETFPVNEDFPSQPQLVVDDKRICTDSRREMEVRINWWKLRPLFGLGTLDTFKFKS